MKEIIILGMGETGFQCPFDAEVWGVNRGYRKARRIDKLFITDRRYDAYGNPTFHIKSLREVKCPIVSLHRFGEIKTVHYPYRRIVNHFKTNFFSDTICYMIAYALYKGYDKIRMYGVDMITTKEYQLEKGGVEFWVGMAMGMGVKVEISKGSAVLQTMTGVPYGFKIPIDQTVIDAYKLLKMKGRKHANSKTNN